MVETNKNDVIQWLKDLHRKLGNFTPRNIQSLPHYEQKFTLKDIHNTFGSYEKGLVEAGIKTQKISSRLPSKEDIIDWLVSLPSPITIKSISNLPLSERKYNISHINKVFGCFNEALDESGLQTYNSNIKTKTLIDTGTTDIYSRSSSPDLVKNDVHKKEKISKHLRIKYDINNIIFDKQPLSSKYTKSKYIHRYYDTMQDAYDEAGVDPIRYKLIDHLHMIYRDIRIPITISTPGLKIIEINKYFGSIHKALVEAHLDKVGYQCNCRVCKKEFESISGIRDICYTCKAIYSHAEQVNTNHNSTIRFVSKNQAIFVKYITSYLLDNYDLTEEDVLQWDKYFDYNGAKWDATIIIPKFKLAVFWYNIPTSDVFKKANKFRHWLITKQCKYKYLVLEESTSEVFSATIIRKGAGLRICNPKMKTILEYMINNEYLPSKEEDIKIENNTI